MREERKEKGCPRSERLGNGRGWGFSVGRDLCVPPCAAGIDDKRYRWHGKGHNILRRGGALLRPKPGPLTRKGLDKKYRWLREEITSRSLPPRGKVSAKLTDEGGDDRPPAVSCCKIAPSSVTARWAAPPFPPRGRQGDNCYVFPSTRPRRSSPPPSGPPGASAPTVGPVTCYHSTTLDGFRYHASGDS